MNRRKLITAIAWLTLSFYSTHAQVISTVAGIGRGDGRLATGLGFTPEVMTADSAGNFYFYSSATNVVYKVMAATGTVTAVAGDGDLHGYGGDGGPATSAKIDWIRGLAVDRSGNLYMSDALNMRIRKVAAATGIITTVAGTGIQGNSGDGGPAISAQVSNPMGLAADANGNIYIADAMCRIRRIDAATGIITTIAGTGTAGYSGDGGTADTALLSSPVAVAVDDSMNIYIADQGNNRIRKIDAATGRISTVAGNGTQSFTGDGGLATSAALNEPSSVAVDHSGNIFIADRSSNRIRRVDHTTHIITTFSGFSVGSFWGDGGQADSALLNAPGGVATDQSGNLYIVDQNNNRIRKVSAATNIITTVAGNGSEGRCCDGGPATSAQLLRPFSVTLDRNDNLYIAEYGNHIVRKVAAGTGIITTLAGNGQTGYSGDGGAATAARFYSPTGIATDSAGNVYIADNQSHTIRKVTVATGIITTVAGTGHGAGTLYGGYLGDGGPATAADLDEPYGVAIGPGGDIYIADANNNKIRKVDAATGIITTVAGTGSWGYSGDGGPATSASLSFPTGMAVDAGGNIYIGDDNSRIRKVNASTGIINTIAGNGGAGFSGDGGPATAAQCYTKCAMTIDGQGNIYIPDEYNNRIRKITSSTGIINTMAGNGATGYNGDGETADSASLFNPTSIAIDAQGNMYIADYLNQRVRRITPCVTHRDTTYDSFCQGSTYTFHGTGISLPGTYSDTVPSASGCDSIHTLVLAYLPGDSIYAYFTLQASSVSEVWYAVNQCSGTLPLSYIWSWGDGSPSSIGDTPTHTFDTSGYYHICVTVSDSLGCSATYCDSLTLLYKNLSQGIRVRVLNKFPESIRSISDTHISLSPNPSSNVVTIAITGNIKSIRLFDEAGALIRNINEVSGSSYRMSIASLTRGLYNVQVISDERVYAAKLIVE